MNTVQRLVKNIGYMGLSQILISVLGFLLTIYLARYLGEEGFGIYNFAIYFTAIFITIADLGISQFMTRELARDHGLFDKFIVNALIIKIPLSVITLFLIVAVINIMGYPQNIIQLVYLFGIYTIFSSFILTFKSIFQAYEKLEYTSLLIILEKTLILPLVLIFILIGLNLVGVSYAYIVSIIITFIFGLYFLFKKINRPKPELDFDLWKTFLKNALPFGLSSLFTISFFRVDTVILSYLKNNAAVGIYNAAYAPLLAITAAFGSMVVYSVYPVMSRYFISSEDSLKLSTVLVSKYSVLLSFPITMGCFVLSGKFINLFYGTQYHQAIIAFQILSLFVPLRLISSITGTFLTSINRQGLRTFGYFVGLLTNIMINIAIIPYLSFVGASISTVISEITVYILFLFFINRYYGSMEIQKQFIKPLVASIIMGMFLWYFNGRNLLLLIVLGAIVYFILLIILKTFTKTDKYIFKQIVGMYSNN